MLALAALPRDAIRSREWARRGIRIEPCDAQPMDQVFARRPSIIVLDIWHATPEQAIGCWQLHDLFGVPVLAVANAAEATDIISLLQRGAADVVSDSPSVPLLAARAKAILRRVGETGGGPPASLRWGDTVVDLTRRVVRRGMAEYPLSRNEFTLLVVLWRAAGRTCTKAQLAAAVTGSHEHGAERNLRTYIHHLRRKLEDNPERPTRLINAWGRGYRLVLAEGDVADEAAEIPSAATDDLTPARRPIFTPEFQTVA